MLEEAVGHAEVAFGILEVDGIYLVRHRRRAHLPSLGFLHQPAVTYVAPNILRKIDNDGVDAPQVVEQLRVRIMWLYLSGRGIELEPYPKVRPWRLLKVGPFRIEPLDELLAELHPIHVRCGSYVRAPIPRRTRELHQNYGFRKPIYLSGKTRLEHFYFFAEGGRARRLSVCAREHRCRGMFFRGFAER